MLNSLLLVVSDIKQLSGPPANNNNIRNQLLSGCLTEAALTCIFFLLGKVSSSTSMFEMGVVRFSHAY